MEHGKKEKGSCIKRLQTVWMCAFGCGQNAEKEANKPEFCQFLIWYGETLPDSAVGKISVRGLSCLCVFVYVPKISAILRCPDSTF